MSFILLISSLLPILEVKSWLPCCAVVIKLSRSSLHKSQNMQLYEVITFVIIIFLILQTLPGRSVLSSINTFLNWWLADILEFHRWGVSGSSERDSQRRTGKCKTWTRLHASCTVQEPTPCQLLCKEVVTYACKADSKAEPYTFIRQSWD